MANNLDDNKKLTSEYVNEGLWVFVRKQTLGQLAEILFEQVGQIDAHNFGTQLELLLNTWIVRARVEQLVDEIRFGRAVRAQTTSDAIQIISVRIARL